MQKDNSSIKIGYINPKYRKPKRKLNLKLIGTSVAAIGAVVVIGVTGSSIVRSFKETFNKSEINIPNDKASVTFNVELQEGDTVSQLASKYYFDDTEDVYDSFSNYTRNIEQQNKRDIDDIVEGEIVQIPVIVDKNNPYYIEIMNINKKIDDIENSNLWVRHKVEYGEDITKLAMLASGSRSETHKLAGYIYNKNHIGPKTVINEGQELWIINPELGSLKQQLNDTLEQLRLSLEQSQIKK